MVGGTHLDRRVGRCFAPYLFNPCKLIDKFNNFLLYCYAKYWYGYKYLVYISMNQISYNNNEMDISTLYTLV
jgi:hypothetical protein